MLKAVDLKKQYKPKGGQVVYALDGVSIDFSETGMVFILGKSGSGKSTLLNVLGGLDKYDSGEVIVKGKSSKDFSQADFDSYRNTFIGFIFQEYNILQEFSVEKNIGLALELQGKKADKEAINALIEQVDLKGYGKRKPNTLSGGQKQRVAIARALVKNPEIIMADEPTGALDSKTGAQVFDTLKKLSKEKLVIVVSHDREFAEYYADRIVELQDGKIISDQYKHEIKPKNSNGIEIVDDKILTIKKGTKLTNDNLDEINSFLLNQQDDVIISVDNDANKEFKKFAKINDEGLKETFYETTSEDVKLKEYDGNVKLIRSKLPMKDSVKMGASGLKTKRFRLVMTILLSAIAFGLFGLADTMASYNKIDNTVQSLIDSKIDYASFEKEKLQGEGKDSWYNYVPINDDDYEMLTNKFGINFLPVYSMNNSYMSNDNLYDRSALGDSGIYLDRYIGATEGTEEDFRSFGNLTGLYPSNYNEVVITKYIADAFVKASYRDLDSNEKVQINSINDMLNKKIRISNTDYVITGIVDTNFDLDRYKDLDGDMSNLSRMLLMDELRSLQSSSMHGLLFFKKGFYDSMNDSNFISVGDDRVFMEYYYDDYSSAYWRANYVGTTDDINSEIVYFNGKTGVSTNQVVIYTNSLRYLNFYIDTTGSFIGINNPERRYMGLQEMFYQDLSWLFKKWCVANNKYQDLFADIDSTYNFDNLVNYYGIINGSLYRVSDGTPWSNTSYEDWFNGTYPTESERTQIKASFEAFLDEFYTKSDNYICQEKMRYELRYGELKTNFDAAVAAHGYTDYEIDTYFNRLIEALINGTAYEIEFTTIDNNLVNEMAKYCFNKTKNSFVAQNYNLYYYNYNGDYEIVGVTYGFKNKKQDNDEAVMIFNKDDGLLKSVSERSGKYRFVVGKINDTSASNLRKLVKFNYEDNDVAYRLNNNVMRSVNNVNDFIETGAKVFLYVGIGFAVFASLLLLNFISISISYKKREIGILRAIGARGMDVFKIFFSEALIIALINFIFAFVGCFIACFFLNRMFRNDYGFLITILHVGIRQLILMLGVSIGVALISSFIPVYLTARKKPIEAIRTA